MSINHDLNTPEYKDSFLSRFHGKRILLLQGPIGPFFKRLSIDLTGAGATVFKINFNGGDRFFYPNAIDYKGRLSDVGDFVQDKVNILNIDIVMLFGDCRPIHIEARKALKDSVMVYVFEEGYIRPNHITLEKIGTNGNSPLFKDLKKHFNWRINDNHIPIIHQQNVGKTYWHAMIWATIYYWATDLSRWRFRYYQHHRPLTFLEGRLWIWGAIKKYWYSIQERGVFEKLTGELRKKYFLVPLQVYNDAQISTHSPYESIEQFITNIMESFATYASSDDMLVLKQHPFDRAYKSYTKFINNEAKRLNIKNRILFIHDQHLPSLIQAAKGVVVINSTVGLQAVTHLCPVKVCGDAIYDVEHLTAQVPLEQFWSCPEGFTPKEIYVKQYINFLMQHTQHNGSFYRRISSGNSATGIIWNNYTPVN